MSAGERLKEVRKAAGVTQEELGRRLGISKVSVCKYEKDKNKASVEMYKRIAEVLDADLLYLIGIHDEPRAKGGILPVPVIPKCCDDCDYCFDYRCFGVHPTKYSGHTKTKPSWCPIREE